MLTLEQKAYNCETFRHIERVRNLIGTVIADLLRRAEEHDQSKLESPEVEIFSDASTPALGPITYGSKEYEDSRKKVEKALLHHYAKNSHHPEHYKDGVNDMSLLDILEMFLDWKASSERHHDGNILKSIEKNADRFGLSPQLIRILENTAKAMGYI